MYDAADTQASNVAQAQKALGQGISKLAFEIVDTAGLLEVLNDTSQTVSQQLGGLSSGADRIGAAVAGMAERLGQIESGTTQSLTRTQDTIEDLKSSGIKAREVAEWVNGLSTRMQPLEESLKRVQTSAARISGIATEVNILAINARIEAARAGEEGRGFAVVAESIGQLSKQTAEVTKTISEEIEGFARSVSEMKGEAKGMSDHAEATIAASSRGDAALSDISRDMGRATSDIQAIAEEARVAGEQNAQFVPVLTDVAGRISEATAEIETGHGTLQRAAERVEGIIQLTVAAEIPTEDSPMITRVTEAAARISALLEQAVASGRITQDALFDTNYRPIPGSDPEQVTTRFTELTDALFPDIQEAMLETDPRIVFCAAVDRNGYLPTHNRKFSQPQGSDPVWNAANCRNRRIFDDRVGLKSGQSTAPFLLQVYRRDMGGGNMVMMKDLSAPIRIAGRHWGGLRLAYKPD